MSFAKQVWTFLSSMKLGLFLLLTVTLASIVGTLLPQKKPGAVPSSIEQFLQLGDVYHSWWFISLLSLLTLNLIACSLYRLKSILSGLRRPDQPKTAEQVMKLTHHDSLVIKGELNQTRDRVEGLLKQEGYTIFSGTEAGEVRLGAQRGRFGVLGSLITHLSFIVILLGGLYGGLYGFKGDINAPVGTTFGLTDVAGFKGHTANFHIKVNDFRVERYENGTPSGFFSELVVLENNQPVKETTIGVNSPLEYRGVKFYQARYGNAVQMELARPDGKIEPASVVEGGYYDIPQTGYSVMVYRYIPDYDPKFGMQSKSAEPNNPRVVYALFEGNQRLGMGAAALNEPIKAGEAGSFKFVKSVPFTGLMVKSDPGLPLVWLGFGLMLLGLYMSFFLQPRQIWAVLKPQGGNTALTIGGTARKNQFAFKDQLACMVAELKTEGRPGQ